MMKNFLLTAVLLLSLCSCGEDGNSQKTPLAKEAGEPVVQQPTGVQIKGDGKGNLSAQEKTAVVNRILQVRARQQAAGLGKGAVKVNKAWNYTGYSYLSVNPDAGIEARLVAVDLTVSGHTVNFDFDDIEIVDGDTLVSYGSDPHAVPLTLSDGSILPANTLPPAAPQAGRWLMIYAFPKDTKTFHLYYWGQKLTLSPVKIEPTGWELPYPEKQ